MRTSIVLALAAAALVVPGAAQAATSLHDGSARGVADCTNADLHASYAGADAATSHVYGQIVLKNISDFTCEVGGYGGLSYVGHGDGTQIGAAADRDTTLTPHKILLQPNQKIVSRVVETSFGVYDHCRPTHVQGFRVYIPNETRSQFIKHPTTGCANPRVHLLSHRAFRRP